MVSTPPWQLAMLGLLKGFLRVLEFSSLRTFGFYELNMSSQLFLEAVELYSYMCCLCGVSVIRISTLVQELGFRVVGILGFTE